MGPDENHPSGEDGEGIPSQQGAMALAGADAPSPPPVDILVATYNSGGTIARALGSARRLFPRSRIIVVDRFSTDSTPQIAANFGAEVLSEDIGLGHARNLALKTATTDPVLFLDGDVEIVRPDFLARAQAEFERARTAAVVGMAVGHSFRYGLPLGLTLVGRQWALSAEIPDSAQGRETYYLQRRARRDRLRVRYVADAMRHAGTFRQARRWPEFQGAAIRRSSGWNPRELVYSGVVVILMHMNSRRPRNILYSPVFYAKLLRGFLDPDRWIRLDRGRVTLPASRTAGPAP